MGRQSESLGIYVSSVGESRYLRLASESLGIYVSHQDCVCVYVNIHVCVFTHTHAHTL
jgi:hypothetical protein